MKKKLFDKAISLIAAAALSCTSVIGSAGSFAAAGSEKTKSAETADSAEDSELVTVIVKVAGDAVLTTPEGEEQGSEFLDTDEAVQMSEALEDTQSYVQKEIRRLYPEMQVKYSYSVLYNGFSCDIPEDLIEAVKALPYVEDVTRSGSYSVPQMAHAPSLSDIPAYYDATGCYGEGTVVCVIDSELDYTHPMFSALDEDIETALKPEDIAEIAAGIGFNVDVDPERAYISNKLPYVIDYVDDPYDGVWNDDGDAYHGTHVSGIAAGNEFTNEEGKTISGIAKNAQIVFMAVGIGGLSIDTDAAIAAIEDAVKLHADVINMSFGRDGEPYDSPEAEVYAAVENAGIVICNSSGNSAEGTLYGGANLTTNPDVSTTNMIPAGTKIMTIASAGNPYTESCRTFTVDGELVMYRETNRSWAFDPFYMGDELQGEYEYVFCGDGMEEDFIDLDLTGKIAVVKLGGLFLAEKAFYAQNAGAVGIIGYEREGDTATPGIVDIEFPSAIINYEDAQRMLASESKTLTFTDETIDIDIPTAVSDFSSWGVKHCLELEPDIMGIGGHVESAAYGDGTSVMDGTSMSSPYVAGCVAVMLEYMDKHGIELKGGDKISYVRNLLMNSATLYTDDDGLYITPRRQGAGLVNMNNMIADKVIMTNSDNDAKINLYDNLEDTFEFDVNLTNISDEDVKFDSARLVLTTNNYYFDNDMMAYCISPTDQIALGCTADVSALTDISAGESRTERISVSLDTKATSHLIEVFTNGFFVEGYLILEGAENCCDISIPLLGFYGDWAQLPIFDKNFTGGVLNLGEDTFMAGVPMAEVIKLLEDILSQITEEELADENADLYGLIHEYATEEQLDAILDSAGEYNYISPNGDGLADNFGIGVSNIRFARAVGLNIYDEKGELVLEGDFVDFPLKQFYTVIQNGILGDLDDGTYTAEASAFIDYASSYENPQKVTEQFIIDTKAPELETEIREENGRKILRLTAADAYLDGIYVTGTGNGGIYGVFDPEGEPKNSADLTLVIEAAKDMMIRGDGLAYSDCNTTMLPVVGKLFSGIYTDTDMADVDFTDIIVAEPDKKGVFTIEYDITDLSTYSFTVTDKAMNISEFATETVLAEAIKPGIYTNSERVSCFTGDTITSALFYNGETSEWKYTFKDGQLMTEGRTYDVYQINSRLLKVVYDDGSVDFLSYQGEGSLEDYHFYTTEQLMASAADLVTMYLPGFTIIRIETSQTNNIVTIEVYVEFGKDELQALVVRIDNTTGLEYRSEYLDDNGLFPVTIDDIASGVWTELREDGRNYWDFDNGVIISQTDKSEMPFSYTIRNTEVIFDLGGTEITAKVSAYDPTFAMITWEDGTVSTMNLAGDSDSFKFYSNEELCAMAAELYTFRTGEAPEMTEAYINADGTVTIQLSETVCYTVDPMSGEGLDENGEYIFIVPENALLPEGAYTLNELIDMALNDYEQKNGVRPEGASAEIIDENTVVISFGDFVDEELETYDYYVVDPVTGEGFDSAGEEVNLPQTGNNAPAAAVMVSAAVLMTVAGAFAVIGSGVLRRKRNEE